MPIEAAYLIISEDDFPEFLRVCIDASPEKGNYAVYAKGLRDFREQFARQGGRAIGFTVKPADMVAWCEEAGRQVNSEGRAAYAAFLLSQSKIEE